MKPWPTTYVGVRYADVDAGIAWLERVYGFEVREVIGPVTVVESSGGGVCTVSALDGPSSGERITSPAISMAVPDVDVHHERAVHEGALILMEPRDLPWGMRAYATQDLGGHHWQFFENR